MTKGVHEIVVKVYDENDEVYGKKTEFTPEMIDGMGWEFIESQVKRDSLAVLNKAYDYEFSGQEPIADFDKLFIWRLVKNINTDEELEMIKGALNLEDD